MTSEDVDAAIEELLLSGRASSASEAEALFLDEHLDEIAALVDGLDDETFENHEAVRLLLSHGSRTAEDQVP
jgi:hypothetical protein